jgi:hypothetical protein
VSVTSTPLQAIHNSFEFTHETTADVRLIQDAVSVLSSFVACNVSTPDEQIVENAVSAPSFVVGIGGFTPDVQLIEDAVSVLSSFVACNGSTPDEQIVENFVSAPSFIVGIGGLTPNRCAAHRGLIEDAVSVLAPLVACNDWTPDEQLVENAVSAPSFVDVGFSEILIDGVIYSIIPKALFVTEHSYWSSKTAI